jgi:hypothetical protein
MAGRVDAGLAATSQHPQDDPGDPGGIVGGDHQVEVVVDGRRVPRPRRETLWFPDAAGRVSGRRHHVTHVDTGALGPAALERAG